MAVDWIKMRSGLASHPRVAALARYQEISIEQCLADLYRLAGWFMEHGEYGKVRSMPDIVDVFIGRSGFTAELIMMGWLKHEHGVLTLHYFCDVSSQRKSLGAKIRAEVLSAGVCAHCGATGTLEIDHIIPISRGGSCGRSNLQPLCPRCNRAKGRRTMEEFSNG
jgi:hypothetical protein